MKLCSRGSECKIWMGLSKLSRVGFMKFPFWQVLRPCMWYLRFMREDSNPHLWINELTLEQAWQHLADKRLLLQGIVPVLRACLLQYEQAVRRGSPISDLTWFCRECGHVTMWPCPYHQANLSLKKTIRLRDRYRYGMSFALDEEKVEGTMRTKNDSHSYPPAYLPATIQIAPFTRPRESIISRESKTAMPKLFCYELKKPVLLYQLPILIFLNICHYFFRI